MKLIPFKEYLEYLKKSREITIEDVRIELEPIRVKRLTPLPEELTDISTTVWSFPKRGSWATHRGDYRGNWPPQMARALIQMYTRPGDTVLDPMIGSGTTCIEAKLLGRNCIGVDINYNAVILALHRLYWLEKALLECRDRGLDNVDGVSLDDIMKASIKIYLGDARSLEKIEDESIDLVATHPPYYNIIRYSRRRESIEGDLSTTRSLEEYLRLLRDIAKEIYRVLKPGKYLGILVGDTRIHKHYVPISHYVLQILLDTGFILKEEVVKIQHKMKTTREVWQKQHRRDFLLIYHEKLFILHKPSNKREYRKYRYSRKQDFITITL
mgnify:CR=1 FL=1